MVFRSFTLLLLLWVILSGRFDALHLGLGVLSCAFIAWFSRDLVFREQISFKRQLRIGSRMFMYLSWLLGQIILSNWFMMKLVFHPRLETQLDPQIVDLNVEDLVSDFAKVLLAQSITLTPGTVSLCLEDKNLKVYAINHVVVPGLEDMHQRVNWVFQA